MPIDNDTNADDTNNPTYTIDDGNARNAIATVASTAPILPAVHANAPAITYIHTISNIFRSPAPDEKRPIRFPILPRLTPIANHDDNKKATVNGNL